MLSLETDVVPGHSTGHTPSLFTELSCGNEEKVLRSPNLRKAAVNLTVVGEEICIALTPAAHRVTPLWTLQGGWRDRRP